MSEKRAETGIVRRSPVYRVSTTASVSRFRQDGREASGTSNSVSPPDFGADGRARRVVAHQARNQPGRDRDDRSSLERPLERDDAILLRPGGVDRPVRAAEVQVGVRLAVLEHGPDEEELDRSVLGRAEEVAGDVDP